MGQHGGGVDPFEAMVGKRQGSEEGRAGSHGMDGGAKVVVEAGQGEIHGAGGAAHVGLGLEDIDLQAGLGEHDGCCKSVRARADDTGFAAATISRGLRH